MNLDDAWLAIDEQRLAVAALLEDLNDQEWTQPSLCEGWTVRDVAAHLTLQQIGPLAGAGPDRQAPRGNEPDDPRRNEPDDPQRRVPPRRPTN